MLLVHAKKPKQKLKRPEQKLFVRKLKSLPKHRLSLSNLQQREKLLLLKQQKLNQHLIFHNANAKKRIGISILDAT